MPSRNCDLRPAQCEWRHTLRAAPQGGGRQLAIEDAKAGGKPPKAAESVATRYRRYTCRIWVPMAQCAVCQLHPPAVNVLDRTHAELFLAGQPQSLRRDAERRADFSCPESPLRLSLQQRIKADCHISPLARARRGLDRRACREAFDQGFDQLLLQPVRCFSVDQRIRSPFDQADCCRMEVAQMPARRRPRPPRSGGGRDTKLGSG